MREELLAEWNRKYERIQWELKDNEKKLQKVIVRQNDLFRDIYVQIIIACLSFGVLFFCWQFRETISYIWYGAFYFFYLAISYGLSIAAVIYNGYQIIKRVRRTIQHMWKPGQMEYPKPETLNSNYPLYIPPNYYAERKCIEWLRHQYTEEMMDLIALKRKIDNTPEQDLAPLQAELDRIVIYERIGRARS